MPSRRYWSWCDDRHTDEVHSFISDEWSPEPRERSPHSAALTSLSVESLAGAYLRDEVLKRQTMPAAGLLVCRASDEQGHTFGHGPGQGPSLVRRESEADRRERFRSASGHKADNPEPE
jgi:hypothetical protein